MIRKKVQNIKFCKWVLFFSFLEFVFIFKSYGQTSQNILLTLNQRFGIADFTPMTYLTNIYNQNSMNFDSSKSFSGIPNDLIKKIIKEVDFQPTQSMYELYLRLKGALPKAALISELQKYHTDTLDLSTIPIKHMVYFLIGINKDGRRVLIIDRNNNLDFSDDNRIEYDSILDTNVQINYQYYYKGRINNHVANIKIGTFGSGIIHYRDNAEQNLFLTMRQNEFQETNFKYQNENYIIQAMNFGKTAFNYDKSGSKINLKRAEDTTNKYYNIGDTIQMGSSRFQISSISIFGDSILLKYLDEKKMIYGNEIGYLAYNIKTFDLYKREFNLSKFQGKYLLLDFWGTWCAPCVASIPSVKNISTTLKSKVQIVSIAYESKDNLTYLKNFVKQNNMNWIHIYQELDNPNNNFIIRDYNITKFPTQILINPSGRIVYRSTTALTISDINKILMANN